MTINFLAEFIPLCLGISVLLNMLLSNITTLYWRSYVCPCITGISLKYNQPDATFSRHIYFYKLFYMFQAVPPPITRSTKQLLSFLYRASFQHMEWKPTDVTILFVYCWISTCFGPTGPSSGEFTQLFTQPLVQYLCRSVRVLCVLWPVLVTILYWKVPVENSHQDRA